MAQNLLARNRSSGLVLTASFVLAACSGSGGSGTTAAATPSGTHPQLVRVDFGRLVDVYGLQSTAEGAGIALYTEGLQYQTRNNASGLPESPNQTGANIRLAIALEGPLAIPGLREDVSSLTGVNNIGRRSAIRDFRSGNQADSSADIARGFVRDPLPPRDELWGCTCGHQWHTFDTGGVCPGCIKQWHSTQCHQCKGWSAHSDWYEY